MTVRKKHAKAKAKAKKKTRAKTYGAEYEPVAPARMGRPTRDPRGLARNYSIHLVPGQMDKLKALAKARGFENVSRMLGAMADGKRKR